MQLISSKGKIRNHKIPTITQLRTLYGLPSYFKLQIMYSVALPQNINRYYGATQPNATLPARRVTSKRCVGNVGFVILIPFSWMPFVVQRLGFEQCGFVRNLLVSLKRHWQYEQSYKFGKLYENKDFALLGRVGMVLICISIGQVLCKLVFCFGTSTYVGRDLGTCQDGVVPGNSQKAWLQFLTLLDSSHSWQQLFSAVKSRFDPHREPFLWDE